MKIIKLIIGILVALVFVLLLAAAFAPSENNMQRSVVIDAPIEAVRANVMSLGAMLKWSPWHELDPNQTFTIENDGAVGAVYSWDGEDSLVGAGNQTITSMDEFNVATKLRFVRPWESIADANIKIVQVDNGVEVTWTYHDEAAYPMNVMNLFLDMESMLGPDFEKGMSKLKEITEKEAKEKNVFRGLTVETVELSPKLYIGIRDTVSWDEMKGFFDSNMPKVYGALKKGKIGVAGAPSGIYYTWDETHRNTDMMAAVPITEGEILGMASYLAEGRALKISYVGDYRGLGEAHLAMEDYMDWHKIQMKDAAIEEYITNPNEVTDTNQWVTHVFYPIVN